MKTLAWIFVLTLASVVAAAACPCGWRDTGDVEITCWAYPDHTICDERPICAEIVPEDPEWSPVMCLSATDVDADRVRAMRYPKKGFNFPL